MKLWRADGQKLSDTYAFVTRSVSTCPSPLPSSSTVPKVARRRSLRLESWRPATSFVSVGEPRRVLPVERIRDPCARSRALILLDVVVQAAAA